jgi:hypothetical protein
MTKLAYIQGYHKFCAHCRLLANVGGISRKLLEMNCWLDDRILWQPFHTAGHGGLSRELVAFCTICIAFEERADLGFQFLALGMLFPS